MFRGSSPALVTIFRDEALDEAAYRDFAAWQIAEGSHGLVPAGTTGESATLTPGEHRRVLEICVEAAAGRVPVIAGRGWNAALDLQDLLYPLHAALFTDASPGPVKYALNKLRPEWSADLRLPMTPASEASRRAVDAALEHAGLA